MGRTEPWGIGGTLLGGAFWRGAGACIYSQGGRGCLVGLWLVRLRVRPVRQGLAGSAAARAWVLLRLYSFWGFSVFGRGLSSKGPRSSRTRQPLPGRPPLIRIRTSQSPSKQSPALIPWEYMQALAPNHAKTQPPSKEPPLSPRHSAPHKRPSIKFQNKPQKAPAPKAPLKEKMKMPRTSSPSQAKP